MKGFTLIESVIVIAIIGMLALVSMNNIIEFQRSATVSSAAQELASTLRVARQNSMSGLVKTGETDTYYGVSLSGNTYELLRYPSADMLEQHTIDPQVAVPTGSFVMTFARITGLPSGNAPITLTHGTNVRTITVNANGLISL